LKTRADWHWYNTIASREQGFVTLYRRIGFFGDIFYVRFSDNPRPRRLESAPHCYRIVEIEGVHDAAQLGGRKGMPQELFFVEGRFVTHYFMRMSDIDAERDE
jgi:hypothetical protein